MQGQTTGASAEATAEAQRAGQPPQGQTNTPDGKVARGFLILVNPTDERLRAALKAFGNLPDDDPDAPPE